MAGSRSVLSDDSTLSRLDLSLYRVERGLGLLSGAAVLLLMGLAVVSVGGRNLFNAPLPGYVDWIQQAMPLIAFMGISFAMRDGGHIRMDIVIGRLQGRALWTAELVTTLVTLLLVALLVWGSYAHFLRSFDCTRPLCSADSSIDIALPLWPAKLLAPIAFGVLTLRLLLQVWGYARAAISGTDTPVAVPLVRSAAELAAEEAQHVSGGETGA